MKEMEIKLLFDLAEQLDSELPFHNPPDDFDLAVAKFVSQLRPLVEDYDALQKLMEVTESKRRRLEGNQ